MGLQNTNENMLRGFGNLVIWLWKSCGKVVEIFMKVFVRTLEVNPCSALKEALVVLLKKPL